MDAPVLAFENDHWSEIPYGRAMRWSRCFFDLPPAWPGAGLTARAYQGFRSGGAAGLRPRLARAPGAEAAGFDPDRSSLLQVTSVDLARRGRLFEEGGR